MRKKNWALEISRRCSKCKELKPMSDFFHDVTKSGGRKYRCKKCEMIRVIEYQKKIGWTRSQKFRDWRIRAGYTSYKYRKDALDKYAQKHPDRLRARSAVQRALTTGLLTRKNCQDCDDPNVQAHHHAGYSKENYLVITWLCREHHRIIHYA